MRDSRTRPIAFLKVMERTMLPTHPTTPLEVRALDAELSLWLPGRPLVRREILRLDEPGSRVVLRPDASPAGVVLQTERDGFHVLLAGPERADVEIGWKCTCTETADLPLWALAQGLDAEASIWDSFGRLVIPNLLARGTDAPRAQLAAGRYLLTASVQGRTSLVLGVGVSADAVLAGLERRATG